MLVKPNIQPSEKYRWGVTADGVLTVVAAKKKAAEEEPVEDWANESGEQEEWDPDFDEFDVPKSRSGKSENKEEEDLNFEEEEEFNDLFDEDGFEEDAASDDY